MAGTLTISTLSDGTNSTSSTNCIQGSAKAWVNFNGTTGAVNSSFNTSSITVVSAGVYTVNLTTAMPNTNYCVQVNNAQNSVSNISSNLGGGLATTTSFRIIHYENGNQVNPFAGSPIYVSVFSS